MSFGWKRVKTCALFLGFFQRKPHVRENSGSRVTARNVRFMLSQHFWSNRISLEPYDRKISKNSQKSKKNTKKITKIPKIPKRYNFMLNQHFWSKNQHFWSSDWSKLVKIDYLENRLTVLADFFHKNPKKSQKNPKNTKNPKKYNFMLNQHFWSKSNISRTV